MSLAFQSSTSLTHETLQTLEGRLLSSNHTVLGPQYYYERLANLILTHLAPRRRYVNNAIRKAARLQHLQNTCLLGCDLKQWQKLLNFLVAIVNSQSHPIPVGCLAHDCWCFEGKSQANITFISTFGLYFLLITVTFRLVQKRGDFWDELISWITPISSGCYLRPSLKLLMTIKETFLHCM